MQKMSSHDDICQIRTAIWRLNGRPTISYGNSILGMFTEIKSIYKCKQQGTIKNYQELLILNAAFRSKRQYINSHIKTQRIDFKMRMQQVQRTRIKNFWEYSRESRIKKKEKKNRKKRLRSMEDRMRQQSLYLIVALEGRIFFFF